MKKRLTWLVVSSLVMSLFAGCTRGLMNSTAGGETDAVTGYESMDEAVQAYLDILYGCDTPSKSEIKRMYPQEVWDYMMEENEREDFDELYEQVLATHETVKKPLKSYFGSDYTLSYDILEKEKATDDDLDEGLAEWGCDPDKLEKAYNLELEVTIDGDENTDTTDSDCAVIIYGGRWYVIAIELSTYEYNSAYYGY